MHRACALAGFWPCCASPMFALSEAASRPPVTSEKGMVVTSQRLASEVGAEILREGGNAVDAAVAVGYALAVVNPCCGNIGGGGFATLHLADGRDIVLNFRERAPLAAHETMYLDDKGEVIEDLSLKGYKAVAVPGTVLGLDTLLRAMERCRARPSWRPPSGWRAKASCWIRATSTSLPARADDFADQPEAAAIFLKQGKAACSGGQARPDGSGGKPRRHRLGGAGCLLQGVDRRKDRRGQRGERRHPLASGFRILHGDGGNTRPLQLSRLSHRLGAAAQLRRNDDLPDHEHPRRLSDEGLRLAFGQVGACHGRGHAPCLRRP